MNTFLQKTFLQESKPRSAAFRYGFLALIIALFVMAAPVVFFSPPSTSHGRYYGFMVPMMLLLNHLAFQFRWSRSMTICLRAAACIFCALGLTYILIQICTR